MLNCILCFHHSLFIAFDLVKRRSNQTVDYGFDNNFYYMEESVLLGTKPLVDSIRHFIRDPSGVFSICHLSECRIVQ